MVNSRYTMRFNHPYVKMKNVFMIICHKNLQQVLRLVQHLITESSDVIVHVDVAVPETDYLDFCDKALSLSTNIMVTDKRIHGILDDRSLVDIVFIMLGYLKEHEKGYKYYYLLSGQDYLIKPINDINNSLFSNYPKPYIDCTPWDNNNWIFHKFNYKQMPNIYKLDKYITDNLRKGSIIRTILRGGVLLTLCVRIVVSEESKLLW